MERCLEFRSRYPSQGCSAFAAASHSSPIRNSAADLVVMSRAYYHVHTSADFQVQVPSFPSKSEEFRARNLRCNWRK
jgi:hypothetical protein